MVRRSKAATLRLPETAIYWGTPTAQGDGSYAYDVPIEIPCRWKEEAELFVDQDGREVISIAVVHVDRVLTKGGWLKLGTLEDLDSGEQIPEQAGGAYEIRKFDDVPPLTVRPSSLANVRRAWL